MQLKAPSQNLAYRIGPALASDGRISFASDESINTCLSRCPPVTSVFLAPTSSGSERFRGGSVSLGGGFSSGGDSVCGGDSFALFQVPGIFILCSCRVCYRICSLPLSPQAVRLFSFPPVLSLLLRPFLSWPVASHSASRIVSLNAT